VGLTATVQQGRDRAAQLRGRASQRDAIADQLTDVSCFAPHTREWLAYLERRVDRILMDEDSGLIPLEVVDAIVATEVEPGIPETAIQPPL